ncbi:hypothetical protein ACFQE0_14125 [Methylobacterium komagatae]|uniref:Uncharacterized protein n=1 Tax=Methylobacterium komagatae TaxID=374425 RepID=A0ABW2BL79_9HYPH
MAHETREPAWDKGTADRIAADDGHAWVRLTTWQALDREGSCMGHCVGDGDYDTAVGSEEMHDDAIWSLRRPDGVSVLTAEVEELWVMSAKGPRNSKVGRFEAMQVAHLVAAFKVAGHALRVSEDTEITLLADGRTFRDDRLSPDVAAARAEAARSLREAHASALAAIRSDAVGERYVMITGRAEFRPAGSPAFIPLGDVAPFGFGAGGGGAVFVNASPGNGGFPGGGGGRGGAARIEERIERLEIRCDEDPRRPILETVSYQTPVHLAMELTANEPDPIVECRYSFDTGMETFRTRSGIRFSDGRQFSLMASGSRDLIQAYRAAIARAEAERAPAQPPTRFQAMMVDAIVTSVTPDGFEARWEGEPRTIEQARVAPGPGQPTTAEPPS